MSRFKIVNVEPYGQDFSIEKTVAKELDAETVFIQTINYDEIYKEIPDCDALVIQYLTIDDDLLDHMPKCKIIVRSAIGVNNIDLEACAKRNVMVANVPDYMQGEVADHIMSMFLSINRKLSYLNQRVRDGFWDAADARPMRLLKTQTMGILGCGQIGQMTAKRAQSFGMKIYGYDPFLAQRRLCRMRYHSGEKRG